MTAKLDEIPAKYMYGVFMRGNQLELSSEDPQIIKADVSGKDTIIFTFKSGDRLEVSFEDLRLFVLSC